MSNIVTFLISLKEKKKACTLLNASAYLLHHGYTFKEETVLSEEVLRDFCLDNIEALAKVHRSFGCVKELKRPQGLLFDDVYFVDEKSNLWGRQSGKITFSDSQRKEILLAVNVRQHQRKHDNDDVVCHVHEDSQKCGGYPQKMMLSCVRKCLLGKGYQMQDADVFAMDIVQKFFQEYWSALFWCHRDLGFERGGSLESQSVLMCGGSEIGFLELPDSTKISEVTGSEDGVVVFKELIDFLRQQNAALQIVQRLLNAVDLLYGLGYRFKGPRRLTSIALQAFCREYSHILEEQGYDRHESFFFADCDLTIKDMYHIDDKGEVRKGCDEEYALDDYRSQEAISALIFKYMDRRSRLRVLASVNKGAAKVLLQSVCCIVEDRPKLAVHLPVCVLPSDLHIFCARNAMWLSAIPARVINVRGQYASLLRGFAAYGDITYNPTSPQCLERLKKIEVMVQIDELCYATQELGITLDSDYDNRLACVDKWSLYDLEQEYKDCEQKIYPLRMLQKNVEKAVKAGYVVDEAKVMEEFARRSLHSIERKTREFKKIAAMKMQTIPGIILEDMDIFARLQALAEVNQGAAKQLLLDVSEAIGLADHLLPSKVSVPYLQDFLKMLRPHYEPQEIIGLRGLGVRLAKGAVF